MRQMASTMLAAEEQYRAAQAADRLGDTPAAMLLIRSYSGLCQTSTTPPG